MDVTDMVNHNTRTGEGKKPHWPWAAYLGTATGAAASIYANIAHAKLRPLDAPADWHVPAAKVLMSAFWPVCLILTIEVAMRTKWNPDNSVSGFLRRVAVLAVAFFSGTISYGHLSGLLGAWFEDEWTRAVGPLVIDGMMIVCAMGLMQAGVERRRFAGKSTQKSTAALTSNPESTVGKSTATPRKVNAPLIPAQKSTARKSTAPLTSNPESTVGKSTLPVDSRLTVGINGQVNAGINGKVNGVNGREVNGSVDFAPRVNGSEVNGVNGEKSTPESTVKVNGAPLTLTPESTKLQRSTVDFETRVNTREVNGEKPDAATVHTMIDEYWEATQGQPRSLTDLALVTARDKGWLSKQLKARDKAAEELARIDDTAEFERQFN